MKVLLVDGFPGLVDASESAPTGARGAKIVQTAHDVLRASNHDVTVLSLAEQGFGRFMSAEERRVYHDDDNLITPQTAASAELVRSHQALLVCTSATQGAISPLAKSWFERVFIPGVSFGFSKSGRMNRGLTHIVRVGMLVDCPEGTAGTNHYMASTKSVMRGARMTASWRCRGTHLALGPKADADAEVRDALKRW